MRTSLSRTPSSIGNTKDSPSILPGDISVPLMESLPQFELDWEPAPHPDWGLISLEEERECSCHPYI